MMPTPFAALVLLLALVTPARRMPLALLLCCLFGASAAIELPALGGAPITPAVLLMPFVVWSALREQGPDRCVQPLLFPQAGFWLLMLVTWGVLSAYFVPRFLDGQTLLYGTDRGCDERRAAAAAAAAVDQPDAVGLRRSGAAHLRGRRCAAAARRPPGGVRRCGAAAGRAERGRGAAQPGRVAPADPEPAGVGAQCRLRHLGRRRRRRAAAHLRHLCRELRLRRVHAAAVRLHGDAVARARAHLGRAACWRWRPWRCCCCRPRRPPTRRWPPTSHWSGWPACGGR